VLAADLLDKFSLTSLLALVVAFCGLDSANDVCVLLGWLLVMYCRGGDTDAIFTFRKLPTII
jgi:hypothetical protein